MSKPLLFVISPISEAESTTRKRADAVLDLLDESVGEIYDVKRADKMKDTRLTDSMLKSLATAPMAVAFLGDPPWNPNVMFEVGYRLALKKPLLILALKGDDAPWDLQDFPQFRLPTWAMKKKKNANKNDDLKKEIKENVLNAQHNGISSSYAVVEVMIDMTKGHSAEKRKDNSVFIWSSPAADRLFQLNDGSLTGMRLEAALNHLAPFLDPGQWEQVDQEQKKLIGKLVLGESDIVSTIPMIFRDDDEVARDELELPEEYRGGAFVAVIVQHNLIENALLLRLLYFRLAGPLQKSVDGKHYYIDGDLPSGSIYEVSDSRNSVVSKQR